MLAALALTGNASSIHAEGRAARALLEEARDTVAKAVGALAPLVTFTSGGTEANNLAVAGAPVARHVVSAIEHPSVLEAARASGRPLAVAPVTAAGVIDLEALERLLPGPPALVSVMFANNETGALQPLRDVVGLCRAHGALVHCDAVQALGKVPVNLGLIGVDLLTLSAHKLGGPQGAGALVVRDGLALTPQLRGGGQERRRRAGTENLAAIAGFAAVADTKSTHVKALRDRLETELEDAMIFARDAARLPGTTCFARPGTSAETLLMAFDLEGIAVSSGSACSSGKVQPSHVLAAMGVEPEQARGAIRVSLGWNTEAADIDRFIAVWRKLRARLGKRAAA
jgi:cysteine desulfurase